MVQNRLQHAIELAQRGERAEARTLLLELVRDNPSLEMGWLWLATVATSPEERLSALRRVVGINPSNETARSALEKLGEPLPAFSQAQEIPEVRLPESETETLSGGGPVAFLKGFNPLEIGAFIAVMIILMVILIGLALNFASEEVILPTRTPTPTFTPTETTLPTTTATSFPTNTPGPSPTPLVLPPTWTPLPSVTARPTRTLAPTWTPRPTRTAFPTLTPLFVDELTATPERLLQPVTFTPEAEE